MESVPVFIKVQEYRRLLRTYDALAAKIESIDSQLATIERLKAEEEGQMQQWTESLESIKESLQDAGQALHRE